MRIDIDTFPAVFFELELSFEHSLFKIFRDVLNERSRDLYPLVSRIETFVRDSARENAFCFKSTTKNMFTVNSTLAP